MQTSQFFHNTYVRKFGLVMIALFLLFIYVPSVWRFYFSINPGWRQSSEVIDENHQISVVNRNYFNTILQDAKKTPSGQIYRNLSKPDDVVHRYLKASLKGSFETPRKIEGSYSSVVLEGEVMYIVFKGNGEVSRCASVGGDGLGSAVDISVGTLFTSSPVTKEAIELLTSSVELETSLSHKSSPTSNQYLKDLLTACAFATL